MAIVTYQGRVYDTQTDEIPRPPGWGESSAKPGTCPFSPYGWSCQRRAVSWLCGCMPSDPAIGRFRPPFWLVYSCDELASLATQQLSFVDPPRMKRRTWWVAAYHCANGTRFALETERELGMIDIQVYRVDKVRRRWHVEQTMYCGG
jgi:hypothetical protein